MRHFLSNIIINTNFFFLNNTERIQHPQFQVVLQDPTSFQPKRRLVPPKRLPEPEEFHNSNRYEHEDDNGNQEEEDYEEKTNYTAPNTPYSRCSIGVSTDEIELELERQEDHKTTHKNQSTELTLENSPPSATSSTISDKATNDTSKRFEDGDPVGNDSLLLSRNSVLYNLIACGGSVSFRGKSKIPVFKEQEVAVARKSSSSHKGVLCRSAAAAEKVVVAAEEEEEEDEIKCMSENPRFGNLQAQEKEYFSGSIVEAISEEERVKGEPAGLKKSSSYNEERLVYL